MKETKNIRKMVEVFTSRNMDLWKHTIISSFFNQDIIVCFHSGEKNVLLKNFERIRIVKSIENCLRIAFELNNSITFRITTLSILASRLASWLPSKRDSIETRDSSSLLTSRLKRDFAPHDFLLCDDTIALVIALIATWIAICIRLESRLFRCKKSRD